MTDLKTVRQFVDLVVETINDLDIAVVSRDDATAIFADVAVKIDEQNRARRRERGSKGARARAKIAVAGKTP